MIETIKITGLEEVKQALAGFSTRLQRRIASESLAASARVFAEAVRAKAPMRSEPGLKTAGKGMTRQPGFLKRHIGFFRQKRKVERGLVKWLAGPTSAAYYARFVEFGHAAGKRKKYGRGVTVATGLKMVPPHPFVEPTFNAAYQAALQVFITDFQIGVADAAKREGLKTR